MILSVSRRTDIPTYYSEWFYNRIKEGFVYTRNPMNPRQVSKIDLSPEVIDCIVFWTKNPKPMLARLDELSAYRYYFQFTLTGYGKDIERNVPHKKERMIPVFKELSERIGADRVIWRYDPIIFTKVYTPEYHLRAFEQIAGELADYTKKCVISFLDMYTKISKNMAKIGAYELDETEIKAFAAELCNIAKANGINMASCAESIDLKECGIEHNSCIDKELVEQIIGCKLKVNKDKNQRSECGCVESIDIGTYNTCMNGCRYCYANYSKENAMKNYRQYDPMSPILCSEITKDDKITERKIKSFKEEQLNLFDI